MAHQPVSVAIEAGGRAFQLYQSVIDSFYYLILLVCELVALFLMENVQDYICFIFDDCVLLLYFVKESICLVKLALA